MHNNAVIYKKCVGGKQGNIEMSRFVASLLIMAHHMYVMGMTDYSFRLAWIYVEFFFILTGYFTAKHFDTTKLIDKKEDAAKRSIEYTLRKYSKILPYSTVAILAVYIIDAIMSHVSTFDEVLVSICNMPYELLMLSSAGASLATPKLAPIWYLSALFLVLPIFCYLLQIKTAVIKYLFCWSIPMIYYGKVGVSCQREWPHDLLRTFVCLMLGVFIYNTSCLLRDKIDSAVIKILATFVEICAFILPMVLTKKNLGLNSLILFCFIIGAILMCSGTTYTALLKGKLVMFLGKISLPLYLVHWVVGRLIAWRLPQMEEKSKIVVYYGGSIGVAILLYLIINRIASKKETSYEKSSINQQKISFHIDGKKG